LKSPSEDFYLLLSLPKSRFWPTVVPVGTGLSWSSPTKDATPCPFLPPSYTRSLTFRPPLYDTGLERFFSSSAKHFGCVSLTWRPCGTSLEALFVILWDVALLGLFFFLGAIQISFSRPAPLPVASKHPFPFLKEGPFPGEQRWRLDRPFVCVQRTRAAVSFLSAPVHGFPDHPGVENQLHFIPLTLRWLFFPLVFVGFDHCEKRMFLDHDLVTLTDPLHMELSFFRVVFLNATVINLAPPPRFVTNFCVYVIFLFPSTLVG